MIVAHARHVREPPLREIVGIHSRDAVANARAHADAAAALIGAHVTGVISVDDTTGQSPQPYYLGDALAQYAGAVAPIPVKHGTQQVAATVVVMFSYAAD